MSALIEPNLHPLIVHFVIAFLITGPLFLLVVALTPAHKPWQDGLQSAGDWMLALGIVAAIAAVIAGLQAYRTVAHDGPSHIAMTDHRNWAFGTVLAFLVMAGWRYLSRRQPPTLTFSLILLIPVVALGVTGWKGGNLVYGHGIGVASLPQSSGTGHDHAHDQDHEGASAQHHPDEPATDAVSHDATTASVTSDKTPESRQEATPGTTTEITTETDPPEHDHSTHQH